MRYFGGKQRIAKALVKDVIQPMLDSGRYNLYVEPFAGSCNVISQVKFDKRLASDIDPYIVATLEAASRGYRFPVNISEEDYKAAKPREGEPDFFAEHLIGFIGYGCSFGAKFFAGYARDRQTNRNFAAEASQSLARKGKLLEGVEFAVASYQDLFETIVADERTLVYCDIPYANSIGYKSGEFDHDEFWQWCNRQKATILVSEYEQNAIEARQADRIIWRKESKQDMKSADGKRRSTVEVVVRIN